ncbi:MAG: hypothetical protein ACRDZY_19580, partial [Acidimicrobiales bacterium]
APASTSATLDRARVAAGQATAVHKRLAALPRQLAGAGAVTVWLTEWQVAADAAADYATALSRPQVDVTRLASAYRQAKQRLDSFAEVNGLDQCRL